MHMSKIFHPLLALMASATENELAKYVEYLKHENTILRSRLPKHVHTTNDERQTLLKCGKIIGRAIAELIWIASLATFARWVQDRRTADLITKDLIMMSFSSTLRLFKVLVSLGVVKDLVTL